MAYQKAHLAYCSNVHPGAQLTSVERNIAEHFTAVRQQRKLNNMASGLWLSAETAETLTQQPQQLEQFKALLKQQGVLLTSLNGFPFGNFHLDVVKEKVYKPTWAEPERLAYTKQLAAILASCLPDNIQQGAISTLPLAYATTWNNTQHQAAIAQLIELSQALKALEQRTNKRIIICIEMEPDCVFQATEQLVNFFTNELLPSAAAQGIEQSEVLRYIGCCFDTCHQGVMNEDIHASLTRITNAGINIGKIQISNAVTANLASDADIIALCQLFQDQKFLHQTKVFSNNNLVAELADLNRAELSKLHQTFGNISAHIHYHIPVNQAAFSQPFLGSTQAAINTTLDFLANNAACRPHIEVETYTWLNLLANDQQQAFNLHQGLTAELTWLEQALKARNLLI